MAILHKLLGINDELPQVMHIDLNSAFATIEQQSNPLLRGRPIGVCSYITPGGIILAPSYEAKKFGIGVGTPVWRARELCPEIVVMMPDPDKYYYVNTQLYQLLYSYTSDLVPLSIDEFVIDFSSSRKARHKSMVSIAKEIKRRIHYEVGDWMRVNIGIGTNRFLAKLAASLHKPNGLDVITAENLRDVYSKLELRDLCGINYRMEARLNAAGIFSPLEFLDASEPKLRKQVYKSILGYQWHQRLRGWEVDGVVYGRKSYGQNYAMPKATNEKKEMAKLIMKLCEKAGRRLRKNNYFALGAHLWLHYSDNTHWHKSKKFSNTLYSTNEIFLAMMRLYNLQDEFKPITNISVQVYNIHPTRPEQLEIFETVHTKQRHVAKSLDEINDRYGEFTVISALMMNMKDTILKRVPFGASKDLKNIYEQYHQEFT